MPVFCRQQVAGVLERQQHLGHLEGLSPRRAVEDDVLHLVRAQVAGFLLAQHPADGVHYVAFAAAVRANHARNALPEVQDDLVSEGLEAFRFEPGKLHGIVFSEKGPANLADVGGWLDGKLCKRLIINTMHLACLGSPHLPALRAAPRLASASQIPGTKTPLPLPPTRTCCYYPSSKKKWKGQE